MTSLRGRLGVLPAVLLLGLSACATRVGPRLEPGHDYLFPRWGPGEVRPEESRQIQKAWRDVLAGKASAAEKRFRQLLRKNAGLVPAKTGLAYALLRAGLLRRASGVFVRILEARPEYVPALAGAGYAALRRGDAETALALYRRAEAADPEEATVRRRLAQVKLQVTERSVAAARSALAEGRDEDAIQDYQRGLEVAPELGGIRVELADLLAGRGDEERAVSVLEADPGRDRQVLLRLGDLLMDLGEPARALGAYRRALASGSHDREALRRAHDARQALELSTMPPEYRKILTAKRLTRAGLAALVAVKVTALERLAPGEARVAVDVSGSWARPHIIKILAWEIMTVYPNHTFQPNATVRRRDVAHAVGRVLDVLEWPASSAPVLRDMSRSSLYHTAASRAVGAGLMDVTANGAFEAWRPVSGTTGVSIIEALARLVGP